MATKQVLLKQSVLATALETPKVANAVLQMFPKESETDTRLAQAAQAMIDEDAAGAASVLADVSLEEVVAFGRGALAIEESLLTESRTALAVAVSSEQKGDWNRSVGQRPTEAGAEVNVQPPNLSGLKTAKPAVYSYLAALAIVPPLAVEFAPTSPEKSTAWAPTAEARSRAIGRRRRALDALAHNANVDPVGYLHLERVQFTPVRYRRGDLMYAITLLPGETIRLTHREWTRTEREFTSLVATSLETETEDALSEKSELTESSTSQRAHSMAFSASLSASGTAGFVTIAANAGMNLSQQGSTTEQVTRQRTREVTRKASSRAKTEHKVTFRTSTTVEVEDVSFRELTNTSEAAARWDFHRMMREWRVRLYRYGHRLTYDLTIPEPGAYLFRSYREMERLEEQMDRPLELPPPSALRADNWRQIAERFQVAIDPPPRPRPVGASRTVTWGGQNDVLVTSDIEILVPDGYELDASTVHAPEPTEAWRGWNPGPPPRPTNRTSYTNMLVDDNRVRMGNRFSGRTFPWAFRTYWTDHPNSGAYVTARVDVEAFPSETLMAGWHARAYGHLLDTLRRRQEDQLANWSRRRDALRAELSRRDDLSLRRLEREELMKGVLRWLFGPSFSFYPSELPQLDDAHRESTSDLTDPYGGGFYDFHTGAVLEGAWQPTLAHGRLITFIHQAVEWENVSYVLYPYFWTDQERWDSKQRFQHPDPQHWQFLRAGAARVVLTIRPGFEDRFLQFADTGELAGTTAGTPYLRIAEELRNEARAEGRTNPDDTSARELGRLIDEWTEYTPTGALDVVRGPNLEP